MWYGWTGKGLEVDLSQEKVKKTRGDRKIYETYLGGRDLITKYFWDRVPPETEPFSPGNMLIFGMSPIVGTAAPSACRTHLLTRSPLTNYLVSCAMGGFWGAELKFAGYDTLIVSGKSPTPVYIYINNDNVEVRDASHLWGKDVFETQQLLEGELKDENVQTICIGLAGENKVYFASIDHGQGHGFSRQGLGAIMGDKKLKAIAVRGTGDVNIARPTPFYDLCDEIRYRPDSYKLLEFNSGGSGRNVTRDSGGSAGGQRANWRGHGFNLDLTYRNFEVSKMWPEGQRMLSQWSRKREGLKIGCFNCPWHCTTSAHLPSGHPVFFKCASRHRFVEAADSQDFDHNLRCVHLAQKYGFDTLSAAAVTAFAIDLYQKGILSKEDTGGLHLEWENTEVIPALLEKIVHREGIGDVLANGVYQAARQIGRGAEQYAVHLRKLEHRGGENQEGRTPEDMARQLTNDRQDTSFGFGTEYWRLDWSGICKWTAGGRPHVPIQPGDHVKLVSYATGLDLDETDLRKYTQRTKALLRAYNAILGEKQTIADLDNLVRDAAKKFSPEVRDKISQTMATRNREMGFSPEGIPTKETLEKLGLDYVAQELDRKGILSEADPVPI